MKHLKLFEEIKIDKNQYIVGSNLSEREISYIYNIFSILKKSRNTFIDWSKSSSRWQDPTEQKGSCIEIYQNDPTRAYEYNNSYIITISKEDGYYYLKIKTKFSEIRNGGPLSNFEIYREFDSIKKTAYFICFLPFIASKSKLYRLVSIIDTSVHFDEIFDISVLYRTYSFDFVHFYNNIFRYVLRNKNIILDYESIKSFIGIDYSGFSDRVKTIIDSGRSDCITYLIEYVSKGMENDPNSGFYKSILSMLFKFKSKMDNKNKMLIDSKKY